MLPPQTRNSSNGNTTDNIHSVKEGERGREEEEEEQAKEEKEERNQHGENRKKGGSETEWEGLSSDEVITGGTQ